MSDAPLILFGAFDRHNLGDILLAHMAVADLAAAEAVPRPVVFAGLAERDLTAWGGHRVHALVSLAKKWDRQRADILHVGGELLTCESYEAAVMLQTPEDAKSNIARYDADSVARQHWAWQTLGISAHLPYLVAKTLFRHPGQIEYRAVGGIDLNRLTPEARSEVLQHLREADRISVRDHTTQSHLANAGIIADLMPDPVSRVPRQFGERIRCHARQGEPARVRNIFPDGYLAAQFAAEYGDDRSLDRIARHLDEHLGRCGLVLFRAGAAPWHDDLAVYMRLAERLSNRRIHLFQSLDVWDISALIASAQGYCGSSLHGRILARAFSVGVLRFPLNTPKLAAYVDTWEGPGETLPATCQTRAQPTD